MSPTGIINGDTASGSAFGTSTSAPKCRSLMLNATVVDDLDGLPKFLGIVWPQQEHMKVGKLWQGWGWMRMRMNVCFWQVDKLWFASTKNKFTSDVNSKMLRTDQLEDHLQTSRQVTDSLTLTSTRDLGFKCLVVDIALYCCRRSHCKFSGLKWFAVFVLRRPLPKRWKSTRPRWTSTCHGIASALKGQKPGVWHGVCGSRFRNGVMKMESWCTIHVRDL